MHDPTLNTQNLSNAVELRIDSLDPPQRRMALRRELRRRWLTGDRTHVSTFVERYPFVLEDSETTLEWRPNSLSRRPGRQGRRLLAFSIPYQVTAHDDKKTNLQLCGRRAVSPVSNHDVERGNV